MQEPSDAAVEEFSLQPNYPNPFNPTTEMAYTIDQPQQVEIVVYNLRGEKIKSLEKGWKETGDYRAIWNGRDELGSPASSGIYLIKLVGSSQQKSIKVTLVR